MRAVPPGVWVRNAGEIGGLGLRCAIALFSRGPSWRREFLIQFGNVFALGFGPVVVISLLVGFSGTGVTGGATLEAFGAVDRLAGAVPVALLREGAPLISSAVMAGVIGTTVTAEFGARVIRDEISALQVMGINPIRNLVLPRVCAITVGMVVLNMVGVVAGVLGAFVAAVTLLSATSSSFIAQALANTGYVDLWASQAKAVVFGLLIGLIASAKGLGATGGPEGVGRAVNASVVTSLLALGFTGLLFTSVFLAIYPDLVVLR
ncbi:MAG: ABC transporter permease [Solirubrobacteraceae bacterium]|nr:ABC transporter permease [Solirubrobacteraceae bacterium]